MLCLHTKGSGSHRKTLIWSIASFALLRNVCPRIKALWLCNPEYWFPKTSWKDFSPCVKQFLRWIMNAVTSYIQNEIIPLIQFLWRESKCTPMMSPPTWSSCLSRNRQTQKFKNSVNVKQKSYVSFNAEVSNSVATQVPKIKLQTSRL